MYDLADLNSLRVKNGKPELKSWKESKAKLQEAYTKEFNAFKATTDAKLDEARTATIEKAIRENKKANEKIVKRTIDGKRYVGPAKNAPKVEKGNAKYEYPEGLTQNQKKVFRAKLRRAKK